MKRVRHLIFQGICNSIFRYETLLVVGGMSCWIINTVAKVRAQKLIVFNPEKYCNLQLIGDDKIQIQQIHLHNNRLSVFVYSRVVPNSGRCIFSLFIFVECLLFWLSVHKRCWQKYALCRFSDSRIGANY